MFVYFIAFEVGVTGGRVVVDICFSISGVIVRGCVLFLVGFAGEGSLNKFAKFIFGYDL